MRGMRRVLLVGAMLLASSFPARAETVSQTLERADRYWSAGQLDQAQQAFEAAVKAEPGSVAVRLRLAGFQRSRQQFEASMVFVTQAISQEPGNSRAGIGLGMAFLHSSRPESARAAFEEAIRADPARKEQLARLLEKLDEKNR